VLVMSLPPCRVLMESKVPEVSRVFLDRREMKAHEAFQDHPDLSAFRLVG